jgi:hypothetical protein
VRIRWKPVLTKRRLQSTDHYPSEATYHNGSNLLDAEGVEEQEQGLYSPLLTSPVSEMRLSPSVPTNP